MSAILVPLATSGTVLVAPVDAQHVLLANFLSLLELPLAQTANLAIGLNKKPLGSNTHADVVLEDILGRPSSVSMDAISAIAANIPSQVSGRSV